MAMQLSMTPPIHESYLWINEIKSFLFNESFRHNIINVLESETDQQIQKLKSEKT